MKNRHAAAPFIFTVKESEAVRAGISAAIILPQVPGAGCRNGSVQRSERPHLHGSKVAPRLALDRNDLSALIPIEC
jgi:hypothetical protein